MKGVSQPQRRIAGKRGRGGTCGERTPYTKMPPSHVGSNPRVQRSGGAVVADVVLLRLPAVSMKGIGTGFFGREGRTRCRRSTGRGGSRPCAGRRWVGGTKGGGCQSVGRGRGWVRVFEWGRLFSLARGRHRVSSGCCVLGSVWIWDG